MTFRLIPLTQPLLCLTLLLASSPLYPQESQTVRETLRRTSVIEIPRPGYPVERTVAQAMHESLVPAARIVYAGDPIPEGREGVLRIHVAHEKRSQGWFTLRLLPDGSGEITVSHPHLLYTAFCRVRDEWADEQVNSFSAARTMSLRFPWLEGQDGLFTGLPRLAREYDPEATIRELARLGCSHVSVNVLSYPAAMEQGVPGEIYPRFYSGSPDLDQFVATDLTRDLYPPEYLAANLALLKKNVELAVTYGLTPGLTVCSPRTMPDAFFVKYPYLRGARVDHPFRSYRPRFTATLSHPLVRWHYAELMRSMMKEVPQLGFLYLWTNDSGSGFEYVSTLYAGRNGGAYLIREWKSDTAIARAAGDNVVRYLRLLRDAASESSPDFRVITSLGWFGAEKDIILEGLDDRLDLHVSSQDTTNPARWAHIRNVKQKLSPLFGSTRAATNFIVGGPAPWLFRERLEEVAALGVGHMAVTFDPPSLSRWSINREVIRAFQCGDTVNVDDIVRSTARRWCGAEAAPALVKAWQLADRAIRAFPDVPLYGNSWAFPLYRHWVRPFVPNISAVPIAERAYYEQHMIATFNNPTLVDFAADALWLLIDLPQAQSIVRTCDSLVWNPLDEAIGLLGTSLSDDSLKRTFLPGTAEILVDQRDRLKALRCYFRTLRNIAGWIAGVHGYTTARTPSERTAMLAMVRGTIDDETRNTEDLLQLWNTSRTPFMPVSATGENWAMYGSNFGSLLEKKIHLMKLHRNDTPFLDPNFMWQVGPGCPVPPSDYLRY